MEEHKMVMTTIAANELSRERENGESIVQTAFKFTLVLIALGLLVAFLIGLWLFNNWAGIIDFGGSLVSWIGDKIGGLWGGLTAIIPATSSFLFSDRRTEVFTSSGIGTRAYLP
jgi:polyferredoxin